MRGKASRAAVAPSLAVLLAALLAAPRAWAGPEDALGAVSRSVYLDAKARAARGDLQGAAELYRRLWDIEPTFTQAIVELGALHEAEAERLAAAGDAEGALRERERAVAIYGEAPYDADAVEAKGRALLRMERWSDAAAAFRRLETLMSESPLPIVLQAQAMARVDAVAGADVLRRYLGYASVRLDDARDAVAAVVEGLREAGRIEEERAVLDAVIARWPEAADDPQIVELGRRGRMEELAKELAQAAYEPLTGEQAARLDAARAAFAREQHGTAKRELKAITAAAPGNPEAWAALSDVYAAMGDYGPAEQAIRRAKAYDPLDPRYPARLADLLVEGWGGRRDAEAADHYATALVLAPQDADLWRKRAEVLRSSRDPAAMEASIAALRRYLALGGVGEARALAEARVAGWDREIPPRPELLRGPGRPDSVPEDAWDAYWVAEAYYRSGAPDVAADEVERALAAKPDWPPALNLKARLAVAGHVDADPIALWEASLAADRDQPAVIEAMGDALAARGDDAQAAALWAEAAAKGSPDALLRLAEDAAEDGRYWQARDHLDAYFSGTTSGRRKDAGALRELVDERILRLQLLGGSGAAFVLLAPVGLVWRRRSGVGLAALLDAAPSAYRDVARTCSVLRHEVLKHNTTLLPVVADALDERDPEPARWAAERLFGPRGAVARFREHVRDLESLGRVHGLRLNLRYRDPVFGPLIAAVDRLASLERDLRRGSGRKLANELREVSRALNEDGYRGLGRLLRRLCLLPADADLVRGAWDAVVGEGGFQGQALPAFSVETDDRRYALRIFRGELEDILANVLRNSLQASLEAGASRVGVRITTEEDEITGLERVAIRVCDDAPKRISTAVIRGRYIERGLGLTVDLISRNGGSIHVESEPGWSKAVVVRLPRAEAPDLEE